MSLKIGPPGDSGNPRSVPPGERLLDRMGDHTFLLILEALTLFAGLHLMLFSR